VSQRIPLDQLTSTVEVLNPVKVDIAVVILHVGPYFVVADGNLFLADQTNPVLYWTIQ
jgi:hypothetical protein